MNCPRTTWVLSALLSLLVLVGCSSDDASGEGDPHPPGSAPACVPGFDFGDGILVLDERGQSSATLTATVSSDNVRAGVLYVGSTGELSFVRSSGNRFGLLLQSGTSGAQPTLLEGNVFEGNAEQDRVEDGDLSVPAAAPPLP